MAIVLNGTTGITNDGGYTGDGVVFADTTPANTLVTTTGGNVGIGTSSPGAKLEVASGRAKFVGNSDQYNIEVKYNAATNGGWVGSPAADVLAFYRGAGGAESGRFDSSGNLLVGTTSLFDTAKVSIQTNSNNGVVVRQNASGGYCYGARAASNGGTYFLMYFQANTTDVGGITSNGTSTTYATSSDYRLKENIQPMTGALAKVAALKPVTYKWKIDGSDGQGFIAHELAEVEPGCVTGEKDAVDAEGNPRYQGIDTSFLTATITAALQELHQIVKDQAAEIAELKAKLP